MAVANGVYRIGSAIKDDMNLDIPNATTATGAKVWLYSENEESNAQKFRVLDDGAYKRIQACCSGKYIDVDNATAVSSAAVWQYPHNGNDSHAQHWIMEDSKKYMFDQQEFTSQIVKFGGDQGYALDVRMSQAVNSNNVWLYETNGTSAQDWIFHRDTIVDKSLGAPASVGAAYSVGGSQYAALQVAPTGTVYPTWLSGSRYFQLRWRFKGRRAGTSEWSGWSSWRSPSDATTDEGWGNAWSYNVDDPRKGNRKYLSTGIPAGLGQAAGQYDKKSYQVQVRAFSPNAHPTYGAAHGYGTTGSIDVVWRPTLIIESMTFTAEGLLVAYASDFKRGDNTITLSRISSGDRLLTARALEFRGCDAEGTLTVPFAELTHMPGKGAPWTTAATIKTVDCSRTMPSATGSIEYDANGGISLRASQTETEGAVVIARLEGTHASQECHIAYEQDGATVLEACPSTSGAFRVMPPFGRAYTLFFKATDSAKAWGALNVNGILVDEDAHMFTYDDGAAWCCIRYAKDPFVAASRSAERSYTAYQTQGRPHESVFLGRGSRSTPCIEGIVSVGPADGYDNSTLDDVRTLFAAGYAVYRTPDGDRRSVAIVSLDEQPLAPGLVQVSLGLKERS